MKAYQAGIAKFIDSNTVIYGISADDLETNKKFAQSLNLDFALLSDTSGEVATKFGVFNAERKIANRKTFLVDTDGKVQFVEEGREAVATDGTAAACSRLHHK